VAYRSLVPWQVLTRKTLVSKHWLTIHEDRVRLANGHEIDQFHVIEGPSWASVITVTDADQIVLVRQYRHGIAGESLELPAGVIEPGEAPLEAARRELREETGYAAETLEPLATFATEPSRHTVRAHFFCARGARLAAARAEDASEDIEVVLVPRPALLELIESGRIVHGIHIAAILLAERRGLLAGA
jgi:8-oxo-dGTP pyrophosphatase MutT (NUDIX family)